MTADPRPSRWRWRPLALVAILSLSGLLRAWGSLTGLPDRYFPDESAKVATALSLQQHSFRHDLHQPGFLYNTLYLAFRVAAPFESSASSSALLRDRLAAGVSWFPYFAWIGRCWMAVLGVATAAVVYAIGRRIGGPAAGLFAAYFFAINPLSIAASNYLKEDTPLTLCLSVAALLCLRLIDSGRVHDATFAGLASGAAFGAKYSGAFALLLLGLAGSVVIARRAPDAATWRSALGLAVGAALGFAAGFALVTPAALLAPGAALQAMTAQLVYMTAGHHDGIALPIRATWGLFYLSRAISPAFGPAGLVAAALGALVVARRSRPAALLLLAWGGGYWLMMEAMPTKPYPFFARYVLPVVPALCVLIGAFCAWSASRAAVDVRARRFGDSAIALLLILLITLPTVTTARFVSSIYPDTRDLAARWMTAQLAPGSIVLPTAYTPELRGARFRLSSLVEPERARKIAEASGRPVYYLLSDLWYQRFFENPTGNPEQLALFSAVFDQAEEVATFETAAPRFGFHNPTLHLLRVPKGAPSRSQLDGERGDAPTS